MGKMSARRVREIENELMQEHIAHMREVGTDEVFAIIEAIVAVRAYRNVLEREEIRRAATQADQEIPLF